ncbi:MAG: hypothetical protein OXG35_28870 [Acidobacteria bacterium]|nr:hypothetical protein [Acidobacteriota bacterium]
MTPKPLTIVYSFFAGCLLLLMLVHLSRTTAPAPRAQEFVTIQQLHAEIDALTEVLCVELKWQDIHRQILDIEVRALHGLAPDGGRVPDISEEHVVAIGMALNSISDRPYLSRLDCEQR